MRKPAASAQGGSGGDAGAGSPSDSRMARMACGSSTVATRRRRPAQRGQASTSTPKARCINCAQVQWRGRACGLSLFFTTATNPSQLAGPFKVYSFNAGWRLRVLSLQYAVGARGTGVLVRWTASRRNSDRRRLRRERELVLH